MNGFEQTVKYDCTETVSKLPTHSTPYSSQEKIYMK
jgi:hypothetical protein